MTEQPSLEALQEHLTELEERVTTLKEENEELEETVESQRQELTEYRKELDAQINKRDAAADHRKHLQQRLHALENENKDTEPQEQPAETRSPLQQLVGLPAKLTEKLTANQERAFHRSGHHRVRHQRPLQLRDRFGSHPSHSERKGGSDATHPDRYKSHGVSRPARKGERPSNQTPRDETRYLHRGCGLGARWNRAS